MSYNTYPQNPFPPNSEEAEKINELQSEINAIKDGSSIDSFGEVELALTTKTNLSNIAPAFDATSGVYAVEDKVIYEGVLYEFTSAHSTAGEWDESEVQPVKVSELIDTLKSGLTNLVKTATETITTNENGWIVFPEGRHVLLATIGDYDTVILTYADQFGYMSRYHLMESTTTPQFEMFSISTEYTVKYWYI